MFGDPLCAVMRERLVVGQLFLPRISHIHAPAGYLLFQCNRLCLPLHVHRNLPARLLGDGRVGHQAPPFAAAPPRDRCFMHGGLDQLCDLLLQQNGVRPFLHGCRSFAGFWSQFLHGGFGPLQALVQPFLLLLGMLRTIRYQPAFAPGYLGAVFHGGLLLSPGTKAFVHLPWRRVVHGCGYEQRPDGREWPQNPLAHQIGHRAGHRQREEIAATFVIECSAGAQTGTLRITHEQEIGLAEHLLKLLPGGHIQGGIGPIAGKSMAHQRHIGRIERAERLVELQHVGPLVFAEAKAQQRVIGLAWLRWRVGAWWTLKEVVS